MTKEEILAILHRHENLSSDVADKIATQLANLIVSRESKQTRVVRAKETR